MPPKDTETLQHELSRESDVGQFLARNSENLRQLTLEEYIAEILKRKNMTKAEVVHRSTLESHYAYHILAGRKAPSRPKIIALALAMELTPKEAQYLLYYSGLNQLYVRNT